MTEDRIDLFVLGATGYAGKHIPKHLALLNKESEYKDLKWGLAGRSTEKIKQLLIELKVTGLDISTLPVVNCDIKDEHSLLQLTRQTKVLINATGPNAILSGPVVKACLANSTHYVDISAELIHIITLYRDFNNEAQRSNVLIVPACGFATIPAVAGLIELEKHFQGPIQSVEGYVVLDIPKKAYIPGPSKSLVHTGTWECFVNEMRDHRKYQALKRQTFPKPPPLPIDMKKRFFHRNKGKTWFPYPGPDVDVIQMSQLHPELKKLRQPYPVQFYSCTPLLIHLILIVPVFFFAYFFCYFNCFCSLLKKYPRVFSFGYFSDKGPTDEMRMNTKYNFTLTGRGWQSGSDLNLPPNKTVSLKVYGSDPGYTSTALSVIFSAITILKEKEKMPSGGVLGIGAAYRDTQIADRLNQHGIMFEIVSNTRPVSLRE